MKAYSLIFTLSQLAFAASAAAQSSSEAPAAPAAEENASTVTAKTLSNHKQGNAESDVQASPDVQEQVGLGTEKEEGKKTTKPLPAKPTSKETTKETEPESDAYGHQMQFGARVGVLFGYRMPFRYDKSPFCEKPDKTKAVTDQKKICGFGGPPALDVALSFAPLDSVEPYIWGRFGLAAESRTDTKPLRAFGAGVRVYTMSDSRFKFFFEPALGYEVEQGRGHLDYSYVDPSNGETSTSDYKKDLLFHVAFGPQYDFMRYVGLYLNLGANVGVLRALNTTLEVQGGLQFRAP